MGNPVLSQLWGFTSVAPEFTSSVPVLCQVPDSRQVPDNKSCDMVSHLVPGLVSGDPTFCLVPQYFFLSKVKLLLFAAYEKTKINMCRTYIQHM